MHDRLLSLSQAARLVGVPRRELQRQIQAGDLEVFEGSVRLSNLQKLYTNVETDRSGMVERVRAIQVQAANKYTSDSLPDRESLASELHRLRIELEHTKGELLCYRDLALEMRDRLLVIQERCDKQQRAVFNALLTWLVNQLQLRK